MGECHGIISVMVTAIIAFRIQQLRHDIAWPISHTLVTVHFHNTL